MKSRSAIDTIIGYFYQFDYSILSLLTLKNDTDEIQIEHIEDVNILTATEKTAVQCKYYAKSEYNHSVIKEPIMLMLDHFKEVKEGAKAAVKYRLYGHFKSGQEKLKKPLTLDFLKNDFLTYRKENSIHYYYSENALDDNDLNEFLGLLEIDTNAKIFAEQFKDIVKALKKIFHCGDFDAEYFFYNNALREIKELAKQQNEKDRVISKKEFIKKINTKKILFDDWFIEYKGSKKFFSELKSKYFSSLNTSPFERFFLIDYSSTTYNRAELKDLLLYISNKWSKTSKREPKPFCPYIFINNLPQNELIEIKKELIDTDFIVIDGFDFAGAEFNPKSILREANHNNKIRLKILNSIDDLTEAINEAKKNIYIYQFYYTETFFETDNPSIFHLKIKIQELNDIKGVF